MKWFLFALFCLLNVYAEGKWRPDYNHERHSDNDQSADNWHKDDPHREKPITWHDKNNREHDHWHSEKNRGNRNWHNDYYNREKHRNWHRKIEHERERHHHGNRWDVEYRRHHGDWQMKETANEISTLKPTDIPDPPDHTKLIPMARYVLRHADWASIATISILPAIEGFPFTNVKSIVDGSKTNSTGVPYFYMSPLDFTAKDLARNTRATVLVSLEETRYCEKKNYDPEDPRCTRLMLSGKMKKVKPDTPEYNFAKAALFERHPAMANFPPDHNWFVAKLKIAQIAMVDWFGGAKYIPVREYLAYNYTEADLPKEFLRTTTGTESFGSQTKDTTPGTITSVETESLGTQTKDSISGTITSVETKTSKAARYTAFPRDTKKEYVAFSHDINA